MEENGTGPSRGGHCVRSKKAKTGSTNRIITIPWLAAKTAEEVGRDITYNERPGVCGRCGAITSERRI